MVVLDPSEQAAVEVAAQQLDSEDYPLQRLADGISATLSQLALMSSWQTPGELSYGKLPYSPGFSLVAIDPLERHGTVIVEFHGFHNETAASRAHIELTKADSARWYGYWVNQFEHIWQSARRV